MHEKIHFKIYQKPIRGHKGMTFAYFLYHFWKLQKFKSNKNSWSNIAHKVDLKFKIARAFFEIIDAKTKHREIFWFIRWESMSIKNRNRIGGGDQKGWLGEMTPEKGRWPTTDFETGVCNATIF